MQFEMSDRKTRLFARGKDTTLQLLWNFRGTLVRVLDALTVGGRESISSALPSRTRSPFSNCSNRFCLAGIFGVGLYKKIFPDLPHNLLIFLESFFFGLETA
jgi:hypothetical protein